MLILHPFIPVFLYLADHIFRIIPTDPDFLPIPNGQRIHYEPDFYLFQSHFFLFEQVTRTIRLRFLVIGQNWIRLALASCFRKSIVICELASCTASHTCVRMALLVCGPARTFSMQIRRICIPYKEAKVETQNRPTMGERMSADSR